MIERISQSFIKAMRSYNAGEECGNIIKEQYVKGILVDRQSPDMAEGSYFEFVLTGALPKSGKIPEPVYMEGPLKKKSKAQLTVADMTAEYRRIHANAAYVKGYFEKMGWKIIEVGKRYVKGRFEGTIDIVVECTRKITFADGTVWKKGDKLCIDIKYSGLLHNKWEVHGWTWSNLQKEYHGTQAKQYHFVTGLPFYFLVVGKTNNEVKDDDGNKIVPPPEIMLFRVPVDEHMIEMHVNEGNQLHKQLAVEKELGLKPRPSFIRCGKCPLKDTCEDKHTYPHVESVDLTIY